MDKRNWPLLGCGVGLRSQHYPVITNEWPRMDWFEAISENYMDTGGRPLHILEKVRCHYPIVLHGTSLSIGSTDPLNYDYLKRLKRLIQRIDPLLVSDHLSWSGVKGEALFDLLPLPFTEEALEHLAPRVEGVQNFLGRQILLENVSAYVTYRHSTMPEWEFLRELARRSGCGILFDVNNLYVNSFNHSFDPHEYLKNIPGELVGQIHLAGHTNMGKFLFDTHSSSVIDPVWQLYQEALELWGPVSTLIEWDEDIPPFEGLLRECEKAKEIYRRFEGSKAKIDRALQRHSQKISRIEIPLSEIQNWFRQRIQPRDRERLASTSMDSKSFLNPQGGDPGEERVSVYANGYPARVRESLAETYEAGHYVLGDENFWELSKAYALRYPSSDYNINYVGRHLAEFLGDSRWPREFPFLIDLARLEWLIWNAFHAFDEKPLRPEEISGIPLKEWEKAQIVFQPSVSLIASSWSILDIWQSRHSPSREVNLDLFKRAQRILIGRKEDQVRCEILDLNQYRLLKGLLKGDCLGALCGELAEATEEENLPLASWFARWVEDGLIIRCEFSTRATASKKNVGVG